MTTCRSEFRWILVLGLAAGVAPVAQAQDPARPTQHTVRTGDTLWDLAARYMGDPFLWPQIYRLNTGIVADPHWIYPGQVLQLVAGADTRAVPEENPAPMAEPAQAPGGEQAPLFPRRPRIDMTAGLIAADDNSYRALSRGDFYSSGFMTEGEALPFGTFLGNVEPQQIASVGDRSFSMLNDAVVVQPPQGATYRAGDSLLVVTLAEGYSGSPQWGDIVAPTALLQVTSVEAGQVRSKVLAVYGEIRKGQMVLPAEQFVSPGTARAQPVQNGITGRIIKARELNPIRHPQDVLFLDIGRAAGVARGDVFEVLREMDGVSDRIATVQVVHVRESTATVRVLHVLNASFPSRATVRKIAALGN